MFSILVAAYYHYAVEVSSALLVTLQLKSEAYYNLLIKRKIIKETQGKQTIYTEILIYAKVLKKGCYSIPDTYLVSCIIILDRAFSKEKRTEYIIFQLQFVNNLKHMFCVLLY